MPESKTYVFGNDANSGMLGVIAPLLQKQGLDPNMVMAMMNNRNGFGGEGGWFMWIIYLFFLMGWGGNGFGNGFGRNGFGGGFLANEISNDYGRDLLLQAINGNRSAIDTLASTLNCSVNSIQQAICALQGKIQDVGNQVGMGT